MKRVFGFILLTALFLGLTAQAAHAQNQALLSGWESWGTVDGMPQDDRYKPFIFTRFRVLVNWPVNAPPLTIPAIPYGPSYFNLAKQVPLGGLHDVALETDAWVWMWTGKDKMEWCWQKAGTVFLFNSDNQPVARKDCHNPSPVIVYLRVPDSPCVRDKWELRRKAQNQDKSWTYWYWNGCEEVPVQVENPPTPTPITVTTTVTTPCPECPTVEIDTWVTRGERFWGGVKDLAISVGTAVVVSVVGSSAGERVRAAVQSAVATAGLHLIFQVMNPNHNRADITVTWPDNRVDTYAGKDALEKGDSLVLQGGGTAKWDKSQKVIKVKFEKCITTREMPENHNLTPVPIIRRNVGGREVTEPVKDQDEPVIAPDERRAGSRRNDGGGQRTFAPTDGGGQVRNSSGSRWNRAMKPNN